MIIGVGIDLCEIARMERVMENQSFLGKCFTESERSYIMARGKMAGQSLAGHFAAKEACVKAMGCGIIFRLTEIEVTHDAVGRPGYALHGKALDKMLELGGKQFHLSITHTEHSAAAVAILEG